MGDFLSEEILEKITKSKGRISDVVVNNLCKEGENFNGILKEVSFNFHEVNSNSTSRYNVILKFPNKDTIFYSMMQNARAFEKETKLYSDFFPSMEEWQKNKFGRIKYELPFPKCFYGNTTERFFFMENLKIQGFRIEQCLLKGLDYVQCKSVMEQLAVFHALSYAYIDSFNDEAAFFRRYEYLKGSTKEQMTEHMKMTKTDKEMLKLLKTFTNVLKLEFPNEEKLFKKVQDWIANVDYVVKSYNFFVESDVFNVICHGDIWGNNILLNKVDENNVRVKFVDLQLIKYCTPAADLIHFFWVSASEDVLSKHMDELIQLYFTTFKNIIDDFNCRISFTLTELLKFVKSLHFSGFTRYIIHAMFTFGEKPKKISVTSEPNEDGMGIFFKECIELMKNANKELLRHGLLRTKVANNLNLFQ